MSTHRAGCFGGAMVGSGQSPGGGGEADIAGGRGQGAGQLVVGRTGIAVVPGLAGAVEELARRYGMETGLAGRDIAPLMFLGSDRQGYFTFSRRGDALLAWSYVGPDGCLSDLVAEWLDYARQHGLAPNLLSLV